MSDPAGRPAFGSRDPSPTLAPSRASVDKAFSGDEKVPSASRSDGDEATDEEIENATGKAGAGPTVETVHTTGGTLGKVETSKSGHHHADDTLAIAKTHTREDGAEYPTGMRLGLILLALSLGVFLMALDNSIIATAIPKITDQFHSLGDVGWYGSAYMLTLAALQLQFGKFYTYFSIKWIFLGVIGIFEIGSLICGVAQNSVTLIVGRAVAGIGSSGIFSGALIILTYSVPLEKRPMYTGLIGSMYGIASVAGPLLGGVFTDKATWRWCFFINLPIGAITLVVIGLLFEDPQRTKHGNQDAAVAGRPTTLWEKLLPFDPIGSLFFMPSIICLLLALQWGGTKYAWSSGRIIALFVVFGVLLAAFVYVQHVQQENATVPPRIAKKRSVWAAGWYGFTLGAGFLGSIYFLPIWFQAVKGASAVRSGLMNLPLLISLVLMSVAAGTLVTVTGYYAPFMVAGTVLASIGFGLLTLLEPSTGHARWIGYQVLAGAGIGLGMQQPLVVVQTVLDIGDVPTGTAVMLFLQSLGGALFVSVEENIFTNFLVTYVHRYVPGLDPLIVLVTGATSIQTAIAPEYLVGVTRAYSEALVKTLVASAAILTMSFLGAVVVEWKSVKGKKIEALPA